VFFGRFIALLRILAGPLAGALKMHYPRFLAANAAGGLFWAGGTTAVVYFLGMAAERWLSRFSWIALVVALACGVVGALLLRHRVEEAVEKFESDTTR
jgi:membrane protein DedA with SNARE-associated domain